MRRSPDRGRLRAIAVALTGIVALASCEGQNLFDVETTGQQGGTGGTGTGTTAGPSDTTRPTVTIQIPARDSLAKPVGDSVFVQARVTDAVGVRSVSFSGTSQRGDKDLGTDVRITRFSGKLVQLPRSVVDTTLTRYLIATSDSLRETVQIIVEASDSVGNTAADTVDLIVGGPDVQLLDLVDGQTVRTSSTLGVRVFARDPLGIIEVSLSTTGGLTYDSSMSLVSVEDTIVSFDLSIPASAGTMEVTATAVNDLGVESSAGPVTLSIVAGGPGDVTGPSVRHESSAPPRMELQETLDVDVFARDDTQGDGVSSVGVTVVATSPDSTVIRTDWVTYATPRTGVVAASFTFPPFNVDTLGLPVDMVYEVTSWAIDAAANCGAGRGLDTLTSNTCAPYGRTLATGEVLDTQDTIQVLNLSGERLTPTVVAGRTITLPNGGKILDAIVDTARKNLYLSNLDLDRIEVFDLANEAFRPPIPVGSEPWGLAMNTCYPVNPSANCGDTLIVGNSGGTNLSMVDLDALAEDGNRRLLTPDVVLFEIGVSLDGTGARRYSLNFIPGGFGYSFAWSDRPQYVARDSTGKLLYSTKTVENITEPVELGTIRRAFVPPGLTRTEVQIFTGHTALLSNPDFRAIANTDDVDVFSVASGDQAIIYDHIPGTTTQIQSIQEEVETAVIDIQGKGSDATIGTGRFDLANIGFKDTTFVASSGDGGWVAIGEGDTEADDQIARIIMYDALTGNVSNAISVVDRMLNDGEVVHGLGLNFDGSLGVARGRDHAYFFTTSLRLQGSPTVEVPGGAGAVLHPLHADARRLDATGSSLGSYHPDTHFAFIPTGENTIDIYDTFHFFRSGRLFIRDVVNGPLRAALPFPTDNAGLSCPTSPVVDLAGNPIGSAVDIFVGDDFQQPYDPTGSGGAGAEDRCIVLKLYGPTTGGGVVVVNVRKGDMLRNHPAR